MTTNQPGPEATVQALQDTPIWVALSGKLTVGTLAGYLIGNFIKQMSDQAIMYLGLSCIMVGGLHYMKWVTINWRQIDNDLLHLWERAKKAEEQGLFEKFKRFLIRTIPLLAGFSTGFYYGFICG